jgi:hypothetical protein
MKDISRSFRDMSRYFKNIIGSFKDIIEYMENRIRTAENKIPLKMKETDNMTVPVNNNNKVIKLIILKTTVCYE